jgi:hypothetical protein
MDYSENGVPLFIGQNGLKYNMWSGNKSYTKKDVIYKKVWKITERKEGQVNKEQVQEIVLLGIVVKDDSTDIKKEVRDQRYDEYTNEYGDEYIVLIHPT